MAPSNPTNTIKKQVNSVKDSHLAKISTITLLAHQGASKKPVLNGQDAHTGIKEKSDPGPGENKRRAEASLPPLQESKKPKHWDINLAEARESFCM